MMRHYPFFFGAALVLPTLCSASTPIPYFSDFEVPEYSPGTLISDPDWSFNSSQLTVDIIDTDSVSPNPMAPGSQSLSIIGSGTFSFFADDPASGSIRWVDFYVKPVFITENEMPVGFTQLQSAISAYVVDGSSGGVFAVDGDGQGSGTWVSTNFQEIALSGDVAQNWIRMSYRLDYTLKRWDLYVDGMLLEYDLGFLDDSLSLMEEFALLSDGNKHTSFDYFYAGPSSPSTLFTDADNDGIDDAVDANSQLNDRDGDADGDSLSNIEEFRLGTGLQNADTDSDLLSDGVELQLGRDPWTADSDVYALQGEESTIGFEPEEGYVPGDLHQQQGWSASGVSVTQYEESYHVYNEPTEIHAERVFGTGTASQIWLGFRAKLHAGALPDVASLESQLAATFVFSDSSTLNVYDPVSDGWIPYTVNVVASEWNAYAVFLDYETKKWNLYVNGELVANSLDFDDPSLLALTRFKAAMVKEAGSSVVAAFDDIQLYSGDDFDSDSLSDHWERLYGMNPASLDSDANGIPDSEEDFDGDALINSQEALAGANPYDRDTDGDLLSDHAEIMWSRDATFADADLALLQPDGLGGYFWQTLFELAEGYVVGALNGQQDWYASSEPTVTVAEVAKLAGTSGAYESMERYFGAEPHSEAWVSFTGTFSSGALPDVQNLTEPAAAIFAFTATNEVSVFDSASGQWVSHTLPASADQSNDYALFFDYNNQTWELYQNGQLVANALPFVESDITSLSRFKAGLETATDGSAESTIDLVQLYVGDDYDADGLDDHWERSAGFSPASQDTDMDGIPDGDES